MWKTCHICIWSFLLFFACQEIDLSSEASEPTSFEEVFDLFWNKMNTGYVYWDIDSTDWDLVYDHYKTKFQRLDLNNAEDILKSHDYFREMTKGIIDGHFNINFTNIFLEGSTIDPLLERRKNSESFSFRYAYNFILHDTIYLDSGFKVGYDYQNTNLGIPLINVCGTINSQIIYFGCNFFFLTKSYENESGSVKGVLDLFFNLLSNLSPDIKGIVIDVRGNPGGDLSDLNFLLGHFIDEPLHIGYTQYKSDIGRLDYTPWVKAYVNPIEGFSKLSLPIVILADNYSASLAETVVLSIKSLPNGILVGERTWGATGPIVKGKIYLSGSFEIPGFMKVQTSSCKFKHIDNRIYESLGIEPDIYVPYTSLYNTDGADMQLEKAIDLIID